MENEGFITYFFWAFITYFFLTFHNLFRSEVLFFSMKEKNRPVMTWMAVEFEFPASEEQEYSPASFWLASWTISPEVVSPDSDWTKLKHKKGTDIWVQYITKIHILYLLYIVWKMCGWDTHRTQLYCNNLNFNPSKIP